MQQYEVSFSRMLNDILILDQLQWLPSDQTFNQFHYLNIELDLRSGFNWRFATVLACQQGTLTLPVTWSVPCFGTCLSFNCWDQITWTCRVFTRLFTLKYPSQLFSICLWSSLLIKLSRKIFKKLQHDPNLTIHTVMRTNELMRIHGTYNHNWWILVVIIHRQVFSESFAKLRLYLLGTVSGQQDM